MPICYQFVGRDVVNEFDVVWKFMNGKCQLFVFCFGSSPFLIFGFNLLICSSSFANFSFSLPFFKVRICYFFKRFEGRCSTPIFELRFWTIWLSTLKEPSLIWIFKDRFELTFRTILSSPYVNQIENHIFYQREEYVKYLQSKRIKVVVWSPLCADINKITKNQIINEITKNITKHQHKLP